MRALRTILLAAGALGLLALVYHLGADAIASALMRITWWQFGLICLLQGAALMVDTCAWRCALAREGAPFRKLLAARCAGDAANVLTAVAVVGGEAIKVWLLRHEIPYEETIPSLILSKTAELIGQVLLLLVAILVAATSGVVSPTILRAMEYLLLVEVLAVGGFVCVQIVGVADKAGRILSWAGIDGDGHAQRLDDALRGFYRDQWRRLLLAVGLHFVGWVLGAVEALVILVSLGLPASAVTAIVLEALWSAVRLATFFVPASLGPLEGANAAAFRALGFGASAGLAFTLVRRARQAVWIGVGVVVLMAMRPTRSLAEPGADVVPSAAD